ncbi:MAG: methylmalonyl-CoA mutase [Candidatus Abyssobacteria bacterium SURF_5]|uniref:Methylmalonyl-CoA mutase n=1 Tax=Abyssobacteria bacterium (strain SURF_5) TaxID=2093360 RepID=A0A3A4NIX0_ABYX5|nr:MAG: methylmalonyl-CoA mutase [Candidatus Abyssubacteria bacterium SURF_5]
MAQGENGYKKWRADYERSKKRNYIFMTTSSREVNPLYTPADLPDFEYERDLGYPGEFPFTRGVHPTMYRGRLWTMRQFAGMGSARDTNKRYHFLLDHGQMGLSVAFDMPTLMGYDSDHTFSEGEVGRCGVAIDSVEDMSVLFDRIPLDQISTSMTINGPASVLFAFYIVVGERQGVTSEKLRGTIQNDILKEYIAQKSWLVPPQPSMRIITDIMSFAAEHVPQWNTISISGYHIREAGSTALQELAFTLADGFAYVEAGIEVGLDVDSFAPRLSFFFNAHNDFFEEVAKYRAARRIWAREMKEKYKAKDPRSWLLRFHTQTAGCSLTAQQPENNIVRTAYQALSAVMGGTQSLHTNSMDETYALPTEKAVRIAMRTQQLIAHESGAANVIDPLAGSYFVEALTNEMERGAYEYFEKIEKFGGVVKAIEAGFFQQEIADAAKCYQREIEAKERIIVGVNDYILENEQTEIPLLKIDPAVEQEQRERVRALREKRDNDKVRRSLEALAEAARSTDNVMPRIIECARSLATKGEICDVLRDVYGRWEEPKIF